MNGTIPLVLDSNSEVQQLQRGTELDIPLEDRFQEFRSQVLELTQFLIAQGIEVPSSLADQLE